MGYSRVEFHDLHVSVFATTVCVEGHRHVAALELSDVHLVVLDFSYPIMAELEKAVRVGIPIELAKKLRDSLTRLLDSSEMSE